MKRYTAIEGYCNYIEYQEKADGEVVMYDDAIAEILRLRVLLLEASNSLGVDGAEWPPMLVERINAELLG